MAYITRKNFLNIIGKIDLDKTSDLEGEVYSKPIYFLSQEEKKYLLAIKALLNGSEAPVLMSNKTKGQNSYILENLQVLYHKTKKCDGLNMDTVNVDPEKIQRKIDIHIKQAEDYFNDCTPDQQDIIKSCLSHTYRAYRDGQIIIEGFIIDDYKPISLLKNFEKNYKRPVKKLILDYYLSLQSTHSGYHVKESVLNRVGFKACVSCYTSG